jgi:hypothetical protein
VKRAVGILRYFSLALVPLAMLALPATSEAAGPNRDPLPHVDTLDAGGSPLDLTAVAFGQRGTELVMTLQTVGAWDTAWLGSIPGSSLCVKLFYGGLATARGQICVYAASATVPGVSYSRLDPFGDVIGNTVVDALVTRPDARTVQAVFDPASVNLAEGRYSWQAQSQWPCDPAGACVDLAPDAGNVLANIKPLNEPRCFGAASRNPLYKCVSPALRLSVVPTPSAAVLQPNARCDIVSRQTPYTCGFGVRASIANRTIALVGDSHASHWRAALEVVAQARRWRGLSLTRSGCPLSTSPPELPKTRRDSCGAWRQAVFSWFRHHPEVSTVFVSELAGLDVRAPAGVSQREYATEGYLRAWQQLPRTVRHIIVLRDTPTTSNDAPDCIARAMAHHQPAGTACAIRRASALPVDPAVIAARRLGRGRVHVIDLTSLMCSRRLCFPVIGGALVHKDKTHLTNVFAGTLGPFLLKKVNGLLGRA